MAKIKKLLASAIAMASTFATVASMSTAFAYTDEEALINSYADPAARDMVVCCLDDGLSLAQAKELVDGYTERNPYSPNARANSPIVTSVNGPYHNSFSKTATDHYLVAIVKDSHAIIDDIFEFSFNSSYVLYGDQYALCSRYRGLSGVYYEVNDDSLSFVVTAVYTGNTSSVHEADAFMKYKLDIIGARNERNIIDNILFSSDVGNNIDYDTFAVGDVNHDGEITGADADALSQYLVRRRDNFDFSYTDDSYNRRSDYAPVTNKLAADYNQDGRLDMNDVVGINTYISDHTDYTNN